MFRESIIHHKFIFIKSCWEKKITRVAFSGAGCQRTARGYGLGRWGYGLGRCQLGCNQFENFLEFLGVEMLKSLVLCYGGSIWHFWRRQMPLRQTNLVEISDLRVLCLPQVWYIHLLHIPVPMVHFVHQRWHQNNKPQEQTVNCHWIWMLLSQFAKEKGQNLGPKAKVRQFLAVFFISFFERIFSLSFRSLPEARLVEPRKPRGDDIHQAAEDGDDPAMRHFLRVAPVRVHEKDSDGPRPQRI